MRKPKPTPPAKVVRCAIYTRKSTEEGLDKEFNSLDAQRDAGEAYIKSQAHEGWTCLPDHYDDGGFTGGNMDRPALQRLLADIQAGKIDMVVVYKVDRLSRSLLDFAKMVELFDQYKVSFVSVTQLINTATSMGRLMLNVLLSFAQFEREIISERTRDKIAAARRKGKWSGGMPVLGYDVDVETTKLVVNPDEAERVQAIFELYLKKQTLLTTVKELNHRDWRTKRWQTRSGTIRGGRPFDKGSLYSLLTNVALVGKVRYKTEVHDGEQPAVITPALWQKVQTLLKRNGQQGGGQVRNKFGAILKGLIRCTACDCAMSPTHVTKNGSKRYRYYVCTNAQKRGWDTCPSKSVPAAEMERFVIDQIKRLVQDPALAQATLLQAQAQIAKERAALDKERGALERELARLRQEAAELDQGTVPVARNAAWFAHVADLGERIGAAERRLVEIGERLGVAEPPPMEFSEIAAAFAEFNPLWDSLTVLEQHRIVELLIARVDYNGAAGKVAITFQPAGIQALAESVGVA